VIEKRIRAVRTIVIEGPEWWVKTTLANSHLNVEKGSIYIGPRGGFLRETKTEIEELPQETSK
jgi:hypothetical protein